MIATKLNRVSFLKGEDMARRRLQKTGDLYKQGGWWKLRWREDQINSENQLVRGWSKPAWLGPSEGTGHLTKKQAERIAWENFLSKLDQNNRVPQSVMTVQQFVDRKFIPEHVALLKKSGRIHYDTVLKHIMPTIGSMRLRDVTSDDLQAIVAKMLRHDYSVQTARHAKNAASAIFRHAISKGWYTGANPASVIRLPETVRRQAHALTIEQAKSVIEALSSPAREMALCAILTSMNVAEICGLQWQHINLSEEWTTVDGEALPPMHLAIRIQWRLGEYTTLKEKSRKREIPIVPMLADVLCGLKARGRFVSPTDPVFVSRTGKPVDEHNISNRHFKKVGRALDMPWLNWHVFRRTTASMADALGASTGARKGLLGHGTEAMAGHYVAKDQEARRAFLEGIASRLSETKGPVQ